MFEIFRPKSHTKPSIPPDPSKLKLRPSESLTLTLPDNRTLGYATYGSPDPSAPVIFMFHGMPGSRLVGRGWDTICKTIGARLITTDRPGYGLSTPANKTFADWPADVLSLADHLGIQQFSVLGGSAGGPFALACARFIPKERLRGTTVVCGIGHIDSLSSWSLMGLVPWSLGIAARWLVLPNIVRPYCTQDPAQMKRVLEDQMVTEEEKALIGDTESDFCLDNSVVAFLEAFKQGATGCMHDGALLTGDWGFDLREVDSEKVWLVYGDQDVTAPLYMAQWIDKQLGGGKLRVLEGRTHSTVWKEHSEEIFRQSAEA